MIIKKLEGTSKTHSLKAILNKSSNFTDDGKAILSDYLTNLKKNNDLDGTNFNLDLKKASFETDKYYLSVLNISASVDGEYNLEIFFLIGKNQVNVSLIKKIHILDNLVNNIDRLVQEMFLAIYKYKNSNYVEPSEEEFFAEIGSDTGDWEEDLDVVDFYDEDRIVKQNLDELGPRPEGMEAWDYWAEQRQIIKDVEKLFENDLKADTK